MSRRVLSIVVVLVVAAAVASVALAAGPSPGTATGGQGVKAPDRAVRYVALPGGTETMLVAISTHNGRVLRSRTIVGSFGIPFVTYAGQTGGSAETGRPWCFRAHREPTRRPSSRSSTRRRCACAPT